MGCCGANRGALLPRRSITISQSQFVGEIKTNFRKYYKICNMLGKGSHGESYVCCHRDSGMARVVTIKSKADVDEHKRRFFNEISVLKVMDHPNVLKLYEIFEDSKRYYIITEMLTGDQLFDHLSTQKAFTEHDAAIIIKQVLGALAYCHSMKIVHRDIKPQNLIYESREEGAKLKVIDFVTSEFYNPNKKLVTKVGSPFYIAPEVLRRSYNEKCDVWSCGVILYILLCGYPPFNGHSRDEILRCISRGEYTMKGKEWELVSTLGKDLVKNMLLYDSEKRYSATQALNHEWIKQYGQEKVDPELTKIVLNELRHFGAQHKLQQAALTYIVSQLATKSEKEYLRAVFLELDKEGKGRLSKQDLLQGYHKVYDSLCNEDEEVEKIMKTIDADGSGFIDYTEFAVAAINKKTLLSRERLVAAFNMFDKDGSGKISLDEIKEVLTGNDSIPSKRWEQVMKEAKGDAKGEITLDEFIKMMQALLSE